jgi:hypothetical protein
VLRRPPYRHCRTCAARARHQAPLHQALSAADGKVERFWRTPDDGVIEGATLDNFDHFANELFGYLVYYNNLRPRWKDDG